MHLTQSLRRAAQIKPDGTATIFAGRRVTYAELRDRAARCASVLRQAGVKAGDRVAVLAGNSDRYVEAFFGAWWAGALIVPLDTQWSQEEVARAIEDCQVEVLLVDRGQAAVLKALKAGFQLPPTVIDISDGPAVDGAVDYGALLAVAPIGVPVSPSPDDIAGIFFTSGAGGDPKGVVLSHANLYINALAGLAEGLSDETALFLLTTPLYHMAAVFFLLMQVIAGAATVIAETFSVEEALALIEHEQISHAGLTPSMIAAMVDHAAFDDLDLTSLRRIVYGVSPISDGVLSRALRRLERVSFVQAYGLTELGPVASVLPAWCHARHGRVAGKLRSAGRAAPHVEMRIVDASGCDVSAGETGEVIVRGPGVMQGYWRRPELTRATLRDGWLHTGDIASMDEDGYIYLVERMGQMIQSAGEPVYATEVENVLSQHPKVAACAVVGTPAGEGVETIHAVVVPRAGSHPTPRELTEHCRHLLAFDKCPATFELRDALPVSDVGKVLKGRLLPAAGV